MVYKAYDPELDRVVAVKRLHRRRAGDTETRSRFEREVLLMRQLDHPALLPILDFDLKPAQPWFATDLCSKGSLADIVVRRAVSTAELLIYALEVLDALSHIHAAGIVHRDIKPENILIDEHDAARLGDFGIAHSPFHNDTQVGSRLGTPSFSSPEQNKDPTLTTPRSDLYGVGAMLYVCQQRRTPVPLLLSRTRRDALERLPTTIRAIVRRATALDPDLRYESAEAMADDVAYALERCG